MNPRLNRPHRLGATILGLLLGACASEPPQSVLFISLDTTRRDHLSLYGYPRDTTPRIDQLGESSAVFENGFAQSSTTNPTHASMFTGLYPTGHGVSTGSRARKNRVTLAQTLRESGFRTGAFVSGYPLRMRRHGLQVGFETWQAGFSGTRRKGRETTDLALAWLGRLEAEEQFLLFVHLYDAHGPYRPNESYLGLFESEDPGPIVERRPRYQRVHGSDGELVQHLHEFIDRYDAQLRYQDDLVAELLDAVDLEHTIVVLVADHGETFGERDPSFNLTHGGAVFDEQLRIPYLIHAPGITPRRWIEPVEQVDLTPTLLDLLQVAQPAGAAFQGESLAPLLRGNREEKGDGLIYAIAQFKAKRYSHLDHDLENGRVVTVRSRRWKLVSYPGVESDYLELFDLERDPLERENVSELFPEVVERLRQSLTAWRAHEIQETEEVELSPEELQKMQALGYFD